MPFTLFHAFWHSPTRLHSLNQKESLDECPQGRWFVVRLFSFLSFFSWTFSVSFFFPFNYIIVIAIESR